MLEKNCENTANVIICDSTVSNSGVCHDLQSSVSEKLSPTSLFFCDEPSIFLQGIKSEKGQNLLSAADSEAIRRTGFHQKIRFDYCGTLCRTQIACMKYPAI